MLSEWGGPVLAVVLVTVGAFALEVRSVVRADGWSKAAKGWWIAGMAVGTWMFVLPGVVVWAIFASLTHRATGARNPSYAPPAIPSAHPHPHPHA